MVMWLRLAAAVVVTLIAMGVLEYLGVSSILGGRSAEEVHGAAHGRTREFFWFLIFAIVMATALLAAARRGADQLRRALVPARRRSL
jgi:hypothetical protein